MKYLIMLALVASLSACYKPLPDNGEFICEMDGVITERHAHVYQAWQTSGGSYRVVYSNHDRAFYTPMRGEYCHLEEVR